MRVKTPPLLALERNPLPISCLKTGYEASEAETTKTSTKRESGNMGKVSKSNVQ